MIAWLNDNSRHSDSEVSQLPCAMDLLLIQTFVIKKYPYDYSHSPVYSMLFHAQNKLIIMCVMSHVNKYD